MSCGSYYGGGCGGISPSYGGCGSYYGGGCGGYSPSPSYGGCGGGGYGGCSYHHKETKLIDRERVRYRSITEIVNEEREQGL